MLLVVRGIGSREYLGNRVYARLCRDATQRKRVSHFVIRALDIFTEHGSMYVTAAIEAQCKGTVALIGMNVPFPGQLRLGWRKGVAVARTTVEDQRQAKDNRCKRWGSQHCGFLSERCSTVARQAHRGALLAPLDALPTGRVT